MGAFGINCCAPRAVESRSCSHLHHPMPTAAGTPTGRLFYSAPTQSPIAPLMARLGSNTIMLRAFIHPNFHTDIRFTVFAPSFCRTLATLYCCGYALQFAALNFLLTAFANYGTWLAQIRVSWGVFRVDFGLSWSRFAIFG